MMVTDFTGMPPRSKGELTRLHDIKLVLGFDTEADAADNLAGAIHDITEHGDDTVSVNTLQRVYEQLSAVRTLLEKPLLTE